MKSLLFALWLIFQVNVCGAAMERGTGQTNTRSEVLNAAVILHIRVEAVQFGPWIDEGDSGMKRREARLQVRLLQTLKGTTRQHDNTTFPAAVSMRGTGTLRVMDYGGVWAHVTLTPGAEFVAFCRGGTHDAAALLTDAHCKQLLLPANALTDTKTALALEAAHASTAQLLTTALQQAGQRRGVFASYVWGKVQAQAFSSLQTITAYAAILTDVHITQQAQSSYLFCVTDAMIPESTPAAVRVILARTLFVVLTMPQAHMEQDNMIRVYLPNALGFYDPHHLSAAAVFAGYDDLHRRVLAVLQHDHTPEAATLRHWLQAK